MSIRCRLFLRALVILLLATLAGASLFAYRLLRTPEPVRLTDSAHAEKISFLALGDQGTGRPAQWRIARAMERVAAENAGVDFTVLMGDNFYSKGVRSTHDRQWNYKFENLYSGDHLNNIPFYAVLGNHDYRGDPEMEIRYGREQLGSGRWQMPDHQYSADFGTDHGRPLLRVAFIDTNRSGDALAGEADFVRQTFSAAGPEPVWRLVVGHHPVRNYGKHGEIPGLAAALLPALRASRVDFYLSGHDHDLQVIARDNEPYYLICGGGGGELYRVPAPHDALVYADSDHGFMKIDVEPAALSVTYYDAAAQVKVRYSLPRRCEGSAASCLQRADAPAP